MNHKKVLIWSLIITAAIWVLFLILGLIFGWFGPWCNTGIDCHGRLAIFFAYSFILLPFYYLIVFGAVYFTVLFYHKKESKQ